MAQEFPSGYEVPAGAWVARFINARFGHPTTIKESLPTVGTASKRIIEPNPRRFAWCLFNLGVAGATFATTQANLVTAGFPLQALGGGASAQADEDGEMVTQEIFGLSSSGTLQLYLLEVVGV